MPISEYLKNLRSKIGHDLLLIPVVSAIVFNSKGQVLICRAKDDGRWHTIGGCIDPFEQPAAAAVREVKEEAGVDVEPVRVVGVYSGPHIVYSNGDEVDCVTISFACRALNDDLPFVADDESLEVRYFDPDKLPEMADHSLKRVLDALANQDHTLFTYSAQT